MWQHQFQDRNLLRIDLRLAGTRWISFSLPTSLPETKENERPTRPAHPVLRYSAHNIPSSRKIIIDTIHHPHRFLLRYVCTHKNICLSRDTESPPSHGLSVPLLHVSMKSCRKYPPSYGHYKQIYLFLRITNTAESFQVYKYQKTGKHFLFVLRFHFIVKLFNVRNGELFLRHLHQFRICLETVFVISKRLPLALSQKKALSGVPPPPDSFQNCLNILTESIFEHLIRLIQHNRMHMIHFMVLQRDPSHVSVPITSCVPLFRERILFYNLLSSIDWQNFIPCIYFARFLISSATWIASSLVRPKNNRLKFLFFGSIFSRRQDSKVCCFSGSCLRLSDPSFPLDHRNCFWTESVMPLQIPYVLLLLIFQDTTLTLPNFNSSINLLFSKQK